MCACICEGVGKGSPVWPWYLTASSAVSALSWPVARSAPWHGGANTGSWAVQCCTPGYRLSYRVHLYWGVGSATPPAPGLSLPLAGCIWTRATQQFNQLVQAVPHVTDSLCSLLVHPQLITLFCQCKWTQTLPPYTFRVKLLHLRTIGT